MQVDMVKIYLIKKKYGGSALGLEGSKLAAAYFHYILQQPSYSGLSFREFILGPELDSLRRKFGPSVV